MTTARTTSLISHQNYEQPKKASIRHGDWIVVRKQGRQGKCLRCKETVTLKLPVRVEIWCAAMRAFCKIHKRCAEPTQ